MRFVTGYTVIVPITRRGVFGYEMKQCFYCAKEHIRDPRFVRCDSKHAARIASIEAAKLIDGGVSGIAGLGFTALTFPRWIVFSTDRLSGRFTTRQK